MQKKSKNRIEISESALNKLNMERLRTGLGSLALLRKATEPPMGLNAAIINTWFMGNAKTAKPDYWDYMMALYQSMPDGDENTITKKHLHHNRRSQNEDFCKVDTALINFHRERTGLSLQDIAPILKQEFETISDAQIKGIFYCHNRTAYHPYYAQILALLKKAPDAKTIGLEAIVYTPSDEYIPFTPDMLERLEKYRQLKLLPSKIFKFIPFEKSHPNSFHVSQWLSGRNKNVRKSDIEFVLELCEEYLKSNQS